MAFLLYLSNATFRFLSCFFFVSFAGSTVSSSVKYDVPSRECYQRHHPIVVIFDIDVDFVFVDVFVDVDVYVDKDVIVDVDVDVDIDVIVDIDVGFDF